MIRCLLSPLLRGPQFRVSGFQSVGWTQSFPLCPVMEMEVNFTLHQQGLPVLFCHGQLRVIALTTVSDRGNMGNPRFECRHFCRSSFRPFSTCWSHLNAVGFRYHSFKMTHHLLSGTQGNCIDLRFLPPCLGHVCDMSKTQIAPLNL